MEHNMAELRERFGNLLDALCRNFKLGDYIDGSCPEDVECNWEEYSDAADHLGIWTGSGCTKLVIGDDNCDYIIKFSPYEYDYDYCAREVEIYNEAVRAGHADKFAWCAKLFDYEFNDWYTLPVYVMEWCQCSYDMIDDEMDDWHYTKYCSSHHTEKNDDMFEKYLNSDERCHKDYGERMMEWAYSVWGLDYNAPVDPEVDTIAKFMRRMFINDIHAGNWGWHNNKLVLVDYSGYGENEQARTIDY